MSEPADRRGLALAAGSYALWGLFPVYFHRVAQVPPLQVLMHRIVWSLLFMTVLLFAMGRWRLVLQAAARPRVLAAAAGSALLLSVNWYLYIWAVGQGRVVDASLGYFIVPLANVLLGWCVLKEPLRRGQWLAVGLAALAVLWMTLQGNGFPWVGVALAATFGWYGLARKTAQVGAIEGLALETAVLAPLAAAGLAWTVTTQTDAYLHADNALRGWLMAAGPITAIPLILFAAGARRIPLSLLGLLQYLAPSLQCLVGIWAYHEPFDATRRTGFALIWLALAVYSVEGLLVARPRNPTAHA